MNDRSRTLVLASASPRRRELLEQLGLTPGVQPADIDETPHHGENTSDYVLRMSLGKAEKIAQSAAAHELVIGADTVIDYQGQIMGKPENLQQCIDMLTLLSGQTHRVLTGVTLICDSLVESSVVETSVCMRVLTETEIRAYWVTGEPQGKAGSYAIQGRGARFIKGISGSYSNVVGLPLFETATMLAGYGISFDEPGAL